MIRSRSGRGVNGDAVFGVRGAFVVCACAQNRPEQRNTDGPEGAVRYSKQRVGHSMPGRLIDSHDTSVTGFAAPGFGRVGGGDSARSAAFFEFQGVPGAKKHTPDCPPASACQNTDFQSSPQVKPQQFQYFIHRNLWRVNTFLLPDARSNVTV